MIQSKTYSIYDEKTNKLKKFSITSAYKIKDCDKLKAKLDFIAGPSTGNLGDSVKTWTRIKMRSYC